MLYDWTGREITEADKSPKARFLAERLTSWEPIDRYEVDSSRALSPASLDLLLREANVGDPQHQARLALEIEEKDPDTAHPLQTRRAGVQSCKWSCQPAVENDAQAKAIADEAEAMLRAVNPTLTGGLDWDIVDFNGCLANMLSAILPGYSWSEIVWAPGGSGILGFAPGPATAITFRQSWAPLIRTTAAPLGLPMAPNKFVFHLHRSRSGDATRGGLIRPLGWMYLFSNLGTKNLLRFVEKFGMPFVSARLDDDAWEKDRTKIAYLIRNFGSDGGGVFSKAVELELMEAASGSGDVFFKLVEHFAQAKEKVILGQLATSSAAGGFSNGQAQERVRFDILKADCEALERTVKATILAPWVHFTHGPDAPVPELQISCAAAEDLKETSEIVRNLSQAGYKTDPEELSKKFGMTLTLAPPPAPPVPPPAPLALDGGDQTTDGTVALSDSGASRQHAAPPSVAANAAVVKGALEAIKEDPVASEKWLRPVDDAIKACLAGMPENPDSADLALFNGHLKAMLKKIPGLFEEMDTSALEEHLANAMFACHTNGKIGRAASLAGRMK